jgi:hypothetical protein
LKRPAGNASDGADGIIEREDPDDGPSLDPWSVRSQYESKRVKPEDPARESIYDRARALKAERQREVEARAGAQPLKPSQLADQEVQARLLAQFDTLPDAPGCVVIAGGSGIRFAVLHGADMQATARQFCSWIMREGSLHREWADHTSHGFADARMIAALYAESTSTAKRLAFEEASRRNALKPRCAMLWGGPT